MSWSNLKAGISVVVKENNNQEITGTNLQNVLITIVNSLGANATCGGIAYPNTSPGTPDGPVFWIASGPGVYVNFGNTKIDNTGIFTWNGASWSFEELDFMKNMQTDIANSVLQGVSFGVTGNTATLTIKQKGYDAITVSVPIATDSQSGFMTAEQAKYIDDLREYTDGLREDIDDLREDIPNLQNKLDAAYGEINIDNIDSLCTADDMLQGKPACYTVLYTLTTSKGTVTVKVGVLWVYSDNLRHVVMQVLNTNFVPDDDGTFSSHTHNHDMHEYSRIYCYDSNAASHAGVAVKTWTQWQEVGGKGIVDLITNVALAKQNKLVAGDKATRIIDDNLETKQIYKGTVINTDVVPVALPVGAYCFNTATKKLYVGAQYGYALVTDTVPMPDDFLFIDTASGTTYRCDGTTLNNIANIKTVNGQSLLGKGNVQFTGEDFLLENGAGVTIDEAVNSNTEELQNKLGKDSIVQTPGTATDKVMSQKGVHDYVNQRLMDSAQSHSSFGSGFCYKLNARQIELLEASDVITLEICGQINGGLNGYNNTAGMQYFGIMFGQHARFGTTNDGAYAWTGDAKLHPIGGTGWEMAVKQDGVEPRMPIDRVLMTINRKTGTCRLYDKCSRKILECTRDEYKSDTWLGGDDYLVVMSQAQAGYISDIWAVRIYDRDVTILQYDNNFRVKDAHMTEAILPFQHPIIAKTIDVNDWVKEKFDKATMDKDHGKPYHFTKTYSYDPDDGLLTGTNDTADWVMIGPGSSNAGNLYGIIDVDFEVTGGNWRVAKQTAIKVYAITKADGTDMGIEGIMSMGSDRTELEAGRYTMSYISFNANAFCDIAPGAKIKMHSMHQHTLHCVCNINPRYFCNGQCWDDARQEWWTPLDVNNHSTPVVPTFSDAAWRAVPAPALLSQPSFNGQLKVDDSGKVYVGVCTGATRTWKQINNT